MKNMEEVRKVTLLALLKVGIRCDLRGFNYLEYAICQIIMSPKKVKNFNKGLYIEMAEHFGVDARSIERDIRNAIDNTSENRSFRTLNELFGMMLYKIDDKPTATELIKLMVEFYRMGLYKKVFKF